MPGLFSLFIILIAGLFFSEVFKRLHLPYVTALIVAGILIGPHGLGIAEVDSNLQFISSIGIIFLMFIAGSENKTEEVEKGDISVYIITFINGIIPFILTFLLAKLFGFGLITSLVLGTVSVSSSIAIVVPSLEASGVIKTKLGRIILSTTMYQDITSLVMLSIFLQSYDRKTFIPLYIYIPLVIGLMLMLKKVVPFLEKEFHQNKRGKDLFESELRFVLIILLASAVLFELLGVHSIIAGFIIGLSLSSSITGKIEEKMRSMSYGLFIPTFFLVIGMQTDLSVIFRENNYYFTVLIILTIILSKVFSGWLGGIITKYNNRDSLLIGVTSMAQLSTTLAVAYAASEIAVLDNNIITSLVLLSIISSFITPLSIDFLAQRREGAFKNFTKKWLLK